MKGRAVAAIVAAQVAIFAAIAISVVDARDSLDREVEVSFESSMARLSGPAARAQPLGCRKTAVDKYECDARLRIRGRPGPATVRYRLVLEDDGCWTTTTRGLEPLPPRIRGPAGCIDD